MSYPALSSIQYATHYSIYRENEICSGQRGEPKSWLALQPIPSSRGRGHAASVVVPYSCPALRFFCDVDETLCTLNVVRNEGKLCTQSFLQPFLRLPGRD